MRFFAVQLYASLLFVVPYDFEPCLRLYFLPQIIYRFRFQMTTVLNI